MRAYRVVPRRDRKTVLSSEPRSRSGSCLCLHDPWFPRRSGQRTRRQHGSAIRGAHVRPQSTQPNVRPPRGALPGYPARSMLAVGPAHSHEVWIKGRFAGSLVPALRPAHSPPGVACAHHSGRRPPGCGSSSTSSCLICEEYRTLNRALFLTLISAHLLDRTRNCHMLRKRPLRQATKHRAYRP
jgi:hypothetical protein